MIIIWSMLILIIIWSETMFQVSHVQSKITKNKCITSHLAVERLPLTSPVHLMIDRRSFRSLSSQDSYRNYIFTNQTFNM